MALVLISFVGKGQAPREGQSVSRGGYSRATYTFTPENNFPTETFTASFFGSALLQRLHRINRPVKRWLLMGTQQSLWNDLIEIFPHDVQERLSDTWTKVDDAIPNHTKHLAPDSLLTQDLLDEWQTHLTSEMHGTEIICRLVGAADSHASQERICQAVFEAVEQGDEIVLDVTHGFRHQSVIASFLVMLLRWLRGVGRVEFYYGAVDLPDCPVLKLDLCQELLLATEAVATYQTTGNYVCLGQALKITGDFDDELAKLNFADEVNRLDISTVTKIKNRLLPLKPNLSSVRAALAVVFEKALEWSTPHDHAIQLGHKARFAFDRDQYFKATPLLWEAILVAGCRKYGIDRPQTHPSREIAEGIIVEHLSTQEKEDLLCFKQLRNAVVHGTRPSRREVHTALKRQTEFKLLFKKNLKIYAKLL